MSVKSSGTLLEILGIEKPIVQAPMAGVATPALAAAVSNAGGLGSLGLGAMNAADARKAIDATRALTARPFNVNLFCHAPAVANREVEQTWLNWLQRHFAQYGAEPPAQLREIYTSFLADEAMQTMLLDARPAVVSFHFGLPDAKLIAAYQQAGIRLLASATNLAEARQVEAAGVDAIVVQGIEAGGHRGLFDASTEDDYLGTFALTRLVARQCSLPVIASGGIMDGAGIVAALALGASAAQLGTAFVSCPETSIDDGYRQALLGAAAEHTTFTRAISGRAARSIVNKFTRLEHEEGSPKTVPAYPITYDAGKALNAAAKAKGEFGYGAQWAGQAAALSRAMPAAELMRTLEAEMRAAVAQLHSTVSNLA
ncbi:Nitronate monooxygenase [Paraburkholderia tropica]|uniref:NAD(P)H-dependent flavin oxidoreductase n=1 Tax=Paraburkholderia tropica TaxID=92647 RepID=UPI001CAFE93A|nr:nitronate monooxygenase [Paraburkholderia tropica]CAG9201449.1 Nitronate monooxygenase [Paraburkholderia tropica]